MSSQLPPMDGEGQGPPGAAAGPGGPGADPTGQPSEEELRAAYEAELERITTAEIIMQTAVSLLNLGARRLRPPESAAPHGAGEPAPGIGVGGDLEQVRDAIDGVRALMGVLERRYPRELAPLRDALSQLQLAYAREAQAPAAPVAGEGAGGAEAGGAAPEAGAGTPPAGTGGGGSGQSKPAGEGAAAEEEQAGRRPGPAESSGRLWVPGR